MNLNPVSTPLSRNMRNSIRSAFIGFLAAISILPISAQAENEPFRPRFHFTPERNWMNDPNGMVYYAVSYTHLTLPTNREV